MALDKVLPETGVGGNYAFVEKLVGEGLVRHVGFSTHGDPKIIRKAIDTKKFSYVNLHHHFFGDYHAAGLDDGFGNLGNAGNVKRAKELDMGVFGISPFDKGGALYRPTKIVADLCGPELPPMAFAANHLWQNNVDTVSVGIAKLSDFDEALDAAKRFEEEGIKEKVEACEVSSRTFNGSQLLSFHIIFIYLQVVLALTFVALPFVSSFVFSRLYFLSINPLSLSLSIPLSSSSSSLSLSLSLSLRNASTTTRLRLSVRTGWTLIGRECPLCSRPRQAASLSATCSGCGLWRRLTA